MEFEQKAEEKKMSMSKNIARLAVTAGLTAALSFGGVMAPVTMAFADDGADRLMIDQPARTPKSVGTFKIGLVLRGLRWANPPLVDTGFRKPSSD